MMRIAALVERLCGQPIDPPVPDAVNNMKHDLDAGIEDGWDARFSDVLKAAEDLWALLHLAVPAVLRKSYLRRTAAT
jgi:hypothetical protein